MPDIDFSTYSTPCYVVDETLLTRNLELLAGVQQRTGCKILLALKAFSMHAALPLVGEYLAGVTASGLFEARLGRETLGTQAEVHAYAPAFPEGQFAELLSVCDHIVFNSFAQWERFAGRVAVCGRPIQCGIRVNPEYSEIETDLYNPCFAHSRMGVRRADFPETLPEGISGLHFHTLCEQGADTLERTLAVFEEKFGAYLHGLEWVNFGGGHHITRPGYDVDTLVRCIEHMRDTYGVQVYLEPGEAVALNAGFMVASVLDVVHNGMPIAILDASAACHMPDVLEMPYRPPVIGAGEPGEKAHTFRLAGPTCLAGDVIGDYSFDRPLRAGDRVVLCDMAIYTMVKNNTFNGMPLPAIYYRHADGQAECVRQFGYEDFKMRL